MFFVCECNNRAFLGYSFTSKQNKKVSPVYIIFFFVVNFLPRVIFIFLLFYVNEVEPKKELIIT